MISETFFSSHYTSIWKSIAPSLEEFVRRANLDGYERYWTPLSSDLNPDRRGIVNEAAYRLFCYTISSNVCDFRDTVQQRVDEAFASATEYVLRKGDEGCAVPPSDAEKVEAANLAERLDTFFRPELGNGVETQPKFEGCGIIAECHGDVLIGLGSLYEIKSGDRSFKSVDYRQLSVYLALHYARHKTVLTSLNLLNPRTGIGVNVDTETFTQHAAGQSATAFCHSVVESFSSTLVSE